MAYEKFIKKDGKLYGPYIYHSKRVDGKVISEYHGQKKIDYTKFFLIGLGVLLLSAFIYFIVFSEKNITGNAVLDLSANYKQGEPLDGKIKLSLQDGELVPSSSKLIVDNNGKISEFNLKDLVSDEIITGNFYVNGASISGSGEGYGVPGEKEVFPDVSFTLSVLSSQKTDGTTISETSRTETTASETVVAETPTIETTTPETTVPETTISETSDIETANTETVIPETTDSETETSSVAPEVAAGLLAVVSNFFLGLTPTGYAVAEFESEISGQVSSGNVFTYTLQEGQRAEIKPRSVKTDSKQLDDDQIILITNGNEITVTTDYSEKETGFGSDYSGSGGKEITIDVSNLGLVLTPGDLKISVVDQGQEIISLTTLIKDEGTVSATEIVETPSKPEQTTTPTEQQTLPSVNVTPNLPDINPNIELTSEERAVLTKEFGNLSVQVAEAKSKNGFVIIRYELGDYWVEHSYDEKLSNETLNSYMERDRIKWLKDIASNLLSQEVPEKNLNEFVKNYSV